MKQQKIIAISHKIKWLDIQDVGRKGVFEFVPAINYKLNDSQIVELIKYENPFRLFKKGISMDLLIKYSMPKMKNEEFKVAQKAHSKLKNFATRCADRVIADLICGLILKHSGNSEDEDITFIIEKTASDKILGRLSYLYLPLHRLTIFFVSYKPEDLMTNVMSFQSGRLEFDLHRLISEEDEGLVGCYPGNPSESLKQTYFFKPPKPESMRKSLFPIRIDSFSQGLLESDFKRKEEILIDILNNHLTPPIKIQEGVFTKLPIKLNDCLDAWKIQEKQLALELNRSNK